MQELHDIFLKIIFSEEDTDTKQLPVQKTAPFAALYTNDAKKIEFALYGCSTSSMTHLFDCSIVFLPLKGEIQVMNASKVLRRIMTGRTTWAVYKNKLALYEGLWPYDKKVKIPEWKDMYTNARDFLRLLLDEWKGGKWQVVKTSELIVFQ